MSRELRRRGALTCLLACLAVLAACTGSPPAGPPAGDPAGVPPAPGDVVAAAVRSLADAGSARVEVELDSPTGPLRAAGPMRFEPFAADLTAALGTRGAQVRAVDGTAWFRLGGGNWQSLSTGMLPLGAVAGALRAAPGLTDVAEQGTEPDGAVRYAGTLDLDAARAADPAAGPRLDELSGLVSPTPRFTAWVGAPGGPEADRGRLLRLRLEPATPATGTQAASAPVPGAVTVGFAEPGLPVEVVAPVD